MSLLDFAKLAMLLKNAETIWKVMLDNIFISGKSHSGNARCGKVEFVLKTIHSEETPLELEFSSGSVICFVLEGKIQFKNKYISVDIVEGMYLSQLAQCQISLRRHTKIMLIIADDAGCLSQIGGPVESMGRLKYIDGCSDTLLISPSRLGEPCLNLLYFPSHTLQTQHHHPSFRFGVVISGEGESVSQGETLPLKSGDCFFIPAFVKHKFNTYEKAMNIIAFHPDSDWGPTDEFHPMKNRTVI